MKDLQQRQTILCGSKGHRGRYTLESPPPATHISYKQEMVGERYGWVEIISAEKRWKKQWNHCYVLTRCTRCGSVQWQLYNNLTRGISKGCQQCSQPRQIPMWLEKRLAAAKSRCENPNAPEYLNYGGRGIRFMFASVIAAGKYLMDQFSPLDKSLDIDRIDTNGHYAPGNLHFVTRAENCANQRRNVLSRFEQKY